jgi:hypothetical protein
MLPLLVPTFQNSPVHRRGRGEGCDLRQRRGVGGTHGGRSRRSARSSRLRGSFHNGAVSLSGAACVRIDPKLYRRDVGFRCVCAANAS